MASRLSPSSSQSSLTASNSSLYEPERRPPDSGSPPSSPTRKSSPDAGSETACASFTIKRKKKKNPLARAASIADPSASSLPFTPSSSSSTPASTSASGSSSGSSQKADSVAPVPTFDIDDLRMAFSLMDTNKDGRISSCELAETLIALGFSTSFTVNDVQNMIHTASEGKESMSENEFISWIMTATHNNSTLVHSITSSIKLKRTTSSSGSAARSSSLSSIDAPELRKSTSSSGGGGIIDDPELEQDLRAAFSVFDQDGNGFLSRDELREAVRVLREDEITDEDLDRLIRKADTDGDGEINFEEFYAYIASLPP